VRLAAFVASGFLCTSCILASGCGDKPVLNAVGSYSDVAILTSPQLLPVATTLEQALEAKVEYSLQPESTLDVDIFDFRDRKEAAIYKNVIVLGLLEGNDAGSRELKRQLAGESMKGSAERDLFLATREDLYSRNQNVLFLAGHERNLMQSAARRQAPAIRGQIELSNRSRLLSFLTSLGRRYPVEEQIRELGGFRLQVPQDYEATRFFGNRERGSIEIAARNPTRTVAIAWEPAPGPEILDDHAYLLERRRRWGEGYLDETLQDAGGFVWSQSSFLGAELPELAGFWEGPTYGGPFRTTFYYDAPTKRLFGINRLCYAPNLPKHVYMRETLAVAESFEPRP
jgi:hypothetical protein